MNSNHNLRRIMGTLLVTDVGLLVLSGIPTFEQADEGWKSFVGTASWLGFVLVSTVLLGLAAVTVWHRRRPDVGATEPGGKGVAVDTGRRTALWGAAALIAAMLADLAETVLDPASSGEAARVVDASVHHHSAMVLCGYLLLASAIFIFPGVFLLTRGLRDRGRRLGRVAVALGFMGALGHAALATAYLVWASMPTAGADDAQLVATLDHVMSSAAVAPLAIGFIAFPLGIVATLGALIRARVAPRWVLIPVVAAPLSAIVSPGGDVAGTSIALLLLLFSTAVVAVRIARGSAPVGDLTWRAGSHGTMTPTVS